MDGDTGQIAWTPSSQRLVAVAAASVGSFLVIFVFLIYRITNEIILARRCIMWARIALLGVVICHAIQLNMDLTVVPRVVLPQLGLVRPVAGGILCFLGFFVSSHPIFRWLVVLLQPLFIISDIYTVSAVQVQVSCREAGTCLVRTGYTLQQLRLLENRNYAAVFFELWFTLVAAYLLICMGACFSRYPVRLFSITKPLSQIPVAKQAAKATQYRPLEPAPGAGMNEIEASRALAATGMYAR